MARQQQPNVAPNVTVYWDDTKHNDAKKNRLRIRDGGKRDILKGTGDEFTPARVLVDLKVDFGNASTGSVTLDDVHLLITYSGADPVLGWWDDGKWDNSSTPRPAKWVTFKHVTYANYVADVTLPARWPTDPAIGTAP